MLCRIPQPLGLLCAVLLLPRPAGAEDLANLDIPVKIGQSVKGIRVPHFNKDGSIALRFSAGHAERASTSQFDFDDLLIEIFKENKDQPALQVVLSEATYDQGTNLLVSHSRSTIHGDGLEIVGSQLEFDVRTRTSKLLGPVSMTIEDTAAKTP
ncbi:MAG: hypothetical protein ACOYOL_04420 [Chthoniobacterales bacterium]